jgi:hypothetical protein
VVDTRVNWICDLAEVIAGLRAEGLGLWVSEIYGHPAALNSDPHSHFNTLGFMCIACQGVMNLPSDELWGCCRLQHRVMMWLQM